jgi:hypothetical protein
LVIKGRIVGIIKNKEPVLLGSCKNLKSFVNTLDRAPENLCNGNEVTLSGGRLIDVDPEYSPEPSVVSYENQDKVEILVKRTLLASNSQPADRPHSSLDLLIL